MNPLEKIISLLFCTIPKGTNWLSQAVSKSKNTTPQGKTHDYTRPEWEDAYIFEPLEHGGGGYITAQDGKVKPGDYLILPDATTADKSCTYQVQEISYYSNPPDMWMALLHRV